VLSRPNIARGQPGAIYRSDGAATAREVRETKKGRTLYRVQFFDKENKRRSIRLGQVNRKAAQTVATRVESIVSASIMGTPLDRETSQWLTGIGQDLADKLAAAGLVAKRETSTLAGFLDAYIASRGDAKPNTIRNLKYSRERLVEYFGADKPLHAIKPGDADEWRQKMVNDDFAEATISKVVKHSKQFFRLAERKGLIRGNPFQELKAAGERNDARLAFIDRPTVAKLLEAAPDARWKLIINDSQTENDALTKSEASQRVSTDCEIMLAGSIPPRGVEPRFSD
jgi:hypothetical protein